MGTIINVNYTASANNELFGVFTLSFHGVDGLLHSVDIKFDPKQLWEFSRDTTSVAFDFLILSLVIYNVDRAVNRLQCSSEGWRRQLKLADVPVINLEAMNRGREAFNRVISFLTGDNWEINFVQALPYQYNPGKNVRQFNIQQYEKVALFSGGLDSLIGFIDEASTLQGDGRILLISHMELGKEHGDQESILEYCRANHIFERKYDQLLLNAGLKQRSWNIKTSTESTFRSRSLLFFAAGIYAVSHINSDLPLIVPENGTISINIPLDSGRRSACSTRTTHPTFIKRLQEALHLVGINNKFYNPYRLKSKADMMYECDQDAIKGPILRDLYSLSCSCAKRGHNSFWDKNGIQIHDSGINHCGMCLPCLYRRVSLDVVGLDFPEELGTDVMHGVKYNISKIEQKRNRDFRALLYFLKNRMSEQIIRRELIMNGIYDRKELDEYVALAIHSYEQIKDWIARKGTSQIKKMAGIL